MPVYRLSEEEVYLESMGGRYIFRFHFTNKFIA